VVQGDVRLCTAGPIPGPVALAAGAAAGCPQALDPGRHQTPSSSRCVLQRIGLSGLIQSCKGVLGLHHIHWRQQHARSASIEQQAAAAGSPSAGATKPSRPSNTLEPCSPGRPAPLLCSSEGAADAARSEKVDKPAKLSATVLVGDAGGCISVEYCCNLLPARCCSARYSSSVRPSGEVGLSGSCCCCCCCCCCCWCCCSSCCRSDTVPCSSGAGSLPLLSRLPLCAAAAAAGPPPDLAANRSGPANMAYPTPGDTAAPAAPPPSPAPPTSLARAASSIGGADTRLRPLRCCCCCPGLPEPTAPGLTAPLDDRLPCDCRCCSSATDKPPADAAAAAPPTAAAAAAPPPPTPPNTPRGDRSRGGRGAGTASRCCCRVSER